MDRLVVLSWLSSDFGFLPFIHLPSFLYSGHQDTLSESLALLSYAWKHYPQMRAIIAGALRYKKGSSDIEARIQLILEPSSLNISRTKLPEALLKETLENFLLTDKRVKNIRLKTLFAGCSKVHEDQLAAQLLKIRPINTSVLHSMYATSDIGSVQGTLSRFNRVTSIVSLAGLHEITATKPSFQQQVVDMDEANLRYFFRRTKVATVTSDCFI